MGFLTDVWDYMRTASDSRLREQGYPRSGMGLMDRYRKSSRFWSPHLENNRKAMLDAARSLGAQKGGTLLVFGCGRLLDVPYESLFPKFDRVVLFDADAGVVPHIERLLESLKTHAEMPKPEFQIGDLTGSVTDVVTRIEQSFRAIGSAAQASTALVSSLGMESVPHPPWADAYGDVRMVVSTNLLSQLGYFPRRNVQNAFKKRFGEEWEKYPAAKSLESYFDRVRARHIHALSGFKGAKAFLSSDIRILTYELKDASTAAQFLTMDIPANAGVELSNEAEKSSEVRMLWPANIYEWEPPLNGQSLRDLWPPHVKLAPPRRWVWHIVPQGSEKVYSEHGRLHVVEAWTADA